MKSTQHPRGSLLIEVLVAASVAVIFSVVVGSLVNANSKSVTASKFQSEAVALAKESMEQLFALKDEHWTNLSAATPGAYTIIQHNNHFILQQDANNPPGEQLPDGFIRTITISKAYRNASGVLAPTGTEDSQARKATVRITWQERGNDKQVELTSFFTQWKGTN